ncbi:hypothetical protein [Promicromonospora soli]|uniref:hypothetical protein n=1 Tax=Promicromonospora soli TaxID=2035533 RepID=UPI001675AEED|nr:hypothetical protein [Promicromonospora soli]
MSTAVGQRAAADEQPRGDDIWVSADGVTFQSSRESDEVAYVVRPVGSDTERSYSRNLTQDEQDSGWAGFWEARSAYPNGYCVVWVEVEDSSNWRETGNSTACSAAEPTSTPTPTSTAKKNDKPRPATAEEPTPVRGNAAVTPTSTPTPSPTPTPTPSATTSPSTSSTPTPSPSHTSPEAALLQNLQDQPAVRVRADAEGDEMISPLGWVAVLGGGAVLTAGGVLLLWRRLV